jgi:hypothetical protein
VTGFELFTAAAGARIVAADFRRLAADRDFGQLDLRRCVWGAFRGAAAGDGCTRLQARSRGRIGGADGAGGATQEREHVFKTLNILLKIIYDNILLFQSIF